MADAPQINPAADGPSAAPSPPQVIAITRQTVIAALRAGWRDFRNCPAIGLAFGALFAFGGLLLVFMVFWSGYFYLAYPTAAGFTLLGPFAVIAVYEVSRQLERGETPSWASVTGPALRKGARRLGWMPAVTLFAFIIWIDVASVIYAIFFGLHAPDLWVLISAIASTGNGILFFIIGNLVGAVFAVLLYSISVIAYPLLMDRGVDPITAIATSVRSVRINPAPMAFYAAIIAVLIIIGTATMFIGLVVILPLLGHATWHLYRKTIA